LARRRVLPWAARAAVDQAGLKLGNSSAPVLPKDADGWLRDLQLVRRLDGAEKVGLATRRSRVLLAGAPDALASLVTRTSLFTSQPNKEAPMLEEKLLARFPERSDALHWAAHVSLLEKRYESAEALLDAAMAVGPIEPEMYYDLACVRALRGDPKGALAQLDRALVAGYRNWDWIDKDPDLSAARADAGFPALLRTHGR
jgi:tetratricopeptide (TPR) repeat protein